MLRGNMWLCFPVFFPVEKPQFVVVVVVNEASLPPNLNYGGLVAAPIFSKMVEKIVSLKIIN